MLIIFSGNYGSVNSDQLRTYRNSLKDPGHSSSRISRRFPTTPKFTIPQEPNLALNRNCYLRIGQVDGHVGTYRTSFTPSHSPLFFGNNAIEKLTWILPRPNFSISGFPANTAVTSSFFGNSCNSCYSSGNGHAINDKPRLLLLTDEHMPPVIGSRGSCLPTLRIESGNFEQLQTIMEYQRSCGFKMRAGSIAIVCFLSHLARVGHSVYWSDLKIFSSWAQKSLNLTVVPSLVPFPVGYSMSTLISFTQMFVNIQAADVGGGSGSGFKFCLWKAFLMSSQNSGAGVVAIPAPPIMVSEAGSLCECNLEFVSGFRGDWRLGPPKQIVAQFLTTVINTLKESDINNMLGQLVLPTPEVIQASLFNAKYLGRKCILIGNSILRNVEAKLISICAESGVETVNLCKGGDFFENFKKLDLSFLKDFSKDDLIILHASGNSLLIKEHHQLADGKYHLLRPQLLTDELAALHIVHLSQILVKLTGLFGGKIILLGPFPRHIEPCCNTHEHAIVDAAGNPVNMVDYTLALSKFIARSPGLSHDSVHYIEYPAIFGDNFMESYLVDGVHLNTGANEMLAQFLFSLLTKLNKPTSHFKKNLQVQLSSLLYKKNIITNDTTDIMNNEEEADNMDGNIDTAIKLIKQ